MSTAYATHTPAPATPLPEHNLLPRDAQNRLRAAARIDPGTPYGESARRIRALESVIFQTRVQYPKLFRFTNH